jgi:hypothetical protein
MAFEFKRHLIKVQGRLYLPVSARLVWFREEHPDWGIETEPIEINHEKQYAVFRARIYNAEGKLMAMGTKKEDVKGFGDYLEKAETGAVGRALALCGFGTQFSPELDESSRGRSADSPYPMGGNRYGAGAGSYSGSRDRYAAGYGDARQDSAADSPSRPGPSREIGASANRQENMASFASRENSLRQPPSTDHEVSRALPTAPPTTDDEISALIGDGDLRATSEDDPFGDESLSVVNTSRTAPKTAAPNADDGRDSAGAPPACTSCGKALTKAQQDLSVRNYGEALCPACQKDRGRSQQPATANR